MSALWVTAGACLLYAALRSWRVPWGWATLGAMLLLTVPQTLAAMTTVSNDAPAIAAGAAAAWLGARILLHGQKGWVLTAVVVTLTALLKSVALLPFAGLGVVLLIRALGHRSADSRPTARNELIQASALAVPAVVVTGAWLELSRQSAEPGWINPIEGAHTRPAVGLPFAEWFAAAAPGALRLGSSYHLEGSVDTPLLGAWAIAFGSLLGCIALVALAGLVARSGEWWLALATIVGQALIPVAVQAQAFRSGTYFWTITDRYGTALVPVAVAVLTILAHRRHTRVAFGALVATGFVPLCASILPPGG